MKRANAPFHPTYDLLVCGGGIYGAWTAYDAALRGLKVIIIDQGDWASGTSSASSKLIHGGLRYLETLDFSVVKKSLLERQLLIESAPYRVWPLRFGVPVVKHSRLGTLKLKIGLSIYDFLAGTFHSQQAHLRFDAQSFYQRFPCLKPADIRCGFTYLDAQTDDARLVMEIIDGACSAGASCLNYCQLIEILEQDNSVKAAVIEDKINHQRITIQTTAIVKAIGQWTTEFKPEKQWCRLSKGVHLVLPKLLDNEALLLTANRDGRVFFVIPWYGKTLLGTTDTDYQGDINNVTVEKEDIDYLLDAANHALSVQWTEKDIQGQFAGLRVLQQSDKNTPSAVTREWELKSLKPGLYHSIGGKLTSSREDAETIVDTVCHDLGLNLPTKTNSQPFPWKPDNNYQSWIQQNCDLAKKLGIDQESSLWLLRRHGKHVNRLFQMIEQDPHLAERITETVPLIIADLIYCMQDEMVYHLEDLVRRRLPLVLLYRMTEVELSSIAEKMAIHLGWDRQTIAQEISNCSKKWLLH